MRNFIEELKPIEHKIIDILNKYYKKSTSPYNSLRPVYYESDPFVSFGSMEWLLKAQVDGYYLSGTETAQYVKELGYDLDNFYCKSSEYTKLVYT